jgi:hypothetical protein
MTSESSGHTSSCPERRTVSSKWLTRLARSCARLSKARGIKSTDVSETAKKARHVDGYNDFDGMRFMCKIGVEPAKDGFKAKNNLDRVIIPDDKEWQPVEQVAKPAPSGAAANGGSSSPSPSNAIVTPVWAQ